MLASISQSNPIYSGITLWACKLLMASQALVPLCICLNVGDACADTLKLPGVYHPGITAVNWNFQGTGIGTCVLFKISRLFLGPRNSKHNVIIFQTIIVFTSLRNTINC